MLCFTIKVLRSHLIRDPASVFETCRDPADGLRPALKAFGEMVFKFCLATPFYPVERSIADPYGKAINSS